MLTYQFIIFNDLDNNINSWLSIGYIASYLETRNDAFVQFSFYKINEVSKAVNEIYVNSPKVIGLPLLQHNFYAALSFCKQIKELLPSIFIVLGNKEAVCYNDYIMKNYPEIDAIVLGEGEVTTSELCHKLSSGQGILDCPGLIVRQGNQIVETPPRPLINDLDDLPFPNRRYRVGNSNIFNVIGSRGCVGNCSFCESNTIFKKNLCFRSPVRCRSISNILDEVSELLVGNKYVVINFLDSTFCSKDKEAINRLEDLYSQIIERKLNFQFNINVRSEQINELFIQCLIKLSYVGLDSILVGLEAGNPDDIRIYNKGASLNEHINAINLLSAELDKKPNFLGVEYGFINFNPYSTIDKLEANADFALKYNIMLYPFDIMSKLRISGSTKITHIIERDGLLTQSINFPITDPYAYKYMDSKVDTLYEVLRKAYSILNPPNTSVVLSKLRRYSIHKMLSQENLEAAMNLNKAVCDITLHIFKEALHLVKNSLPTNPLFSYAAEQNKKLQLPSEEVKKIENRVSVNLAKIDELPHFN